jgi:hypothetical protein
MASTVARPWTFFHARDIVFLSSAFTCPSSQAELLDVLNPLEVGDGDAACVCEDVGDDDLADPVQDLVGGQRDRMVGRLHDHASLDPVGVPLVDDAVESGRDEHVHVELEQLVVRDRLRSRPFGL